MLCRHGDIKMKSSGRENSSSAKRYRLVYLRSHWKRCEIYRFSPSTTQNCLRRPTMLANIFEGFEPPSNKFLAALLNFFRFWWKSYTKCCTNDNVMSLVRRLSLPALCSSSISGHDLEMEECRGRKIIELKIWR